MRDRHCSFAQLNGKGRCIASCHYNRKYDGIDCIGNEGVTMNDIDTHEVPVSCGFTPWMGSGLQKQEALQTYLDRQSRHYGGI